MIVREWDRQRLRPPGALVFADQEGGGVRVFPDAAPWRAASACRSVGEAFAAGRATAAALRARGIDVDFAPVLNRRGPLARAGELDGAVRRVLEFRSRALRARGR